MKGNKVLMYFIILFPFFKPEYLVRIPIISILFNDWKIISLIIVILLILKRGRLTKQFLLLLLFCFWLTFITIIKMGDFKTVFTFSISIISLSYIVEEGIRNIKSFIKSLILCFEIVIYINLISIILFPQGLYTTGSTLIGTALSNWFLGYDNTHIAYYLPAYIVSYIYMNLFKKSFRGKALIIAILLSSIICWSATTMVGIFMMILFSALPCIKRNTKIFNLKNYLLLTIFLFLFIVIFRMQNKFEFLIVDILKKDLTFTNRTILWEITLTYIVKHLLFGYGWQSASIRHLMYNSKTIIFAHNQILEYLYLGGIVCIIIYLSLWLYAIKSTKKNKNNENIQIIHVAFLILQILSITEVYLNPIMYLVLIFTVYSSAIADSIKESRNEKKIINNYSSL